MGDRSAIEWTEATWNPIRGCSRVSEGCRNCYAERQAGRQISGAYSGLVRRSVSTSANGGFLWTGEVRLVDDALDLPLRWKKPRRIFVNSMSDLFHEKVPDEWIEQIVGRMALSPRHTFQILTKRPERMRKSIFSRILPLPNVWLGVSVENKPTADERIPLLLQTPAAVRWVSYEPALGPVDFTPWLKRMAYPDAPRHIDPPYPIEHVAWVVVGGESGPGARPFELAWARSAIAQCRAAGVPCFVKQLGARPIIPAVERTLTGPAVLAAQRAIDRQWPEGTHFGNPTSDPALNGRVALLRDRKKGGDPAEWPEDLRVREYPRRA